MSTKPKLSEMEPKQRRIAAAELLGWTRLENTFGEPILYPPGTIRRRWRGSPKALPNPDVDANDAFAIVEHLRAKGWWFECFNGATFWKAIFIKRGRPAKGNEREVKEAQEPTACLAITSAALLAAGVAE